MKNKRLLIFFLVSFITLTTLLDIRSAVASSDVPPRVALPDTRSANLSGNMDDIAKTLATYFPKVTGKVISVDLPKVAIQTENETGLSEGIFLSAYRVGEPFYHPVTKAELGHFEDEIAVLEVIQVTVGQVIARVVNTTGATGATQTIVPGDLVRLTAARIPIMVVTEAVEETGEDRFLIGELRSALEETGRFKATQETSPKKSIYLITFTLKNNLSHIEIKNSQTGVSVAAFEVTLETSDTNGSIVESLQHRLFEKHKQ
ncbi:MAG: hypothetical protein AAB300_01970 [Nitrospirota bacterium]